MEPFLKIPSDEGSVLSEVARRRGIDLSTLICEVIDKAVIGYAQDLAEVHDWELIDD